MSDEEAENLEKLLAPHSDRKRQTEALRWCADHLEENYILNLSPPKKVMDALKSFTRKPHADEALKKKAQKLLKTYRIQ